MDEYKFVNPSAPPACVKAYSLPPAYPNQIQFQPPTLPQDWGDKGVEGKQKLAAQMTAWITTILIIITFLAILYTIFKNVDTYPPCPGYASPCIHSARYSEAPHARIFRRSCQFGFGGSHVGAFRIRRSTPIAIKDHRLSPHLQHAHYKTLLLQTAADRLQNIVLCDLDCNIIKLPALGKISLWSTNDLPSIENNIPYQIRVYGRVLDLVIPLEIKDDVHITDHRLY